MKTLTIRTFLFAIALAVVGCPIAPATAAASPNLFASVGADGTLINGNAVSSVTHNVGSGQYEVTFTSDVSNCAYVSTTQNAFSQAIQSFTAGGHLSSSGVYVEVKNQGGGLMDGPFDLAVACNMIGWNFAVVGYNADLVRSSGATLNHLSAGRYDVNFAASVASCAYLASVGDPGNSLVFNPAGVYTGSGPTANSVYIETKNTGGGLTDGIPFHLAVICPSAPSTKILVVQSTGLPKRGSALTSSFSSSTGNYIFATNLNLSSCTMIGTRGSINKSVPFTPTTVEITPGPAPNSSGIQVRDLLFFGGGLDNQAFHAAGIC